MREDESMGHPEEGIEAGLARLDERVGGVEVRLGSLETKVDEGSRAVDQRFEAVDKRFDGVDRAVAELRTDMRQLNGRLDAGLRHLDTKLNALLVAIVVGVLGLIGTDLSGLGG